MKVKPENNKVPNQNSGGADDSQEFDYEKGYKSLQPEYTKNQQALKALEAQVNTLKGMVKPSINVDEATQERLDDLKIKDPDAWRNEMNVLENEARNTLQQELDNKLNEATQRAATSSREQILANFNQANPNLQLSPEVLSMDVPPRLTAKLNSGEISYEQFLTDSAKSIYGPKVISEGDEALSQPNLSNMGGSDTATENSEENKGSFEQNYNNKYLW